MDDMIEFTPSGPDTLCDRAMVMANLAATVDATSNPEAQTLLLRTMEAVLDSIIPKYLVKEGSNVVSFKNG